MAGTSAHYKQMKYLMRSKVFVSGIKQRNFQCINDTTDRVNDSSGKQPPEGRFGQSVENLGKCQNTQPAHSNIDNRRKPFGAVDPESFDQIGRAHV